MLRLSTFPNEQNLRHYLFSFYLVSIFPMTFNFLASQKMSSRIGYWRPDLIPNWRFQIKLVTRPTRTKSQWLHFLFGFPQTWILKSLLISRTYVCTGHIIHISSFDFQKKIWTAGCHSTSSCSLQVRWVGSWAVDYRGNEPLTLIYNSFLKIDPLQEYNAVQ